jgi:hypothetical protein
MDAKRWQVLASAVGGSNSSPTGSGKTNWQRLGHHRAPRPAPWNWALATCSAGCLVQGFALPPWEPARKAAKLLTPAVINPVSRFHIP